VGGVGFELMAFVLVVVLALGVFGGIGALVAGFQNKRSILPALAVGMLSGLWGCYLAAGIAEQFFGADLTGRIIVAAIIFAIPFGPTLFGHWIVAEIRWDDRKSLGRPLTQEDDASANGDEREAE
jgi:hypothetical protein